ncbi:hypothetical protein Q2T40_11580 [Winogradskyella maritima]|uniref:Uncharacterized protein n=1 Tax=Winogradskyella maritima TaxID=1517766 RepID=A0ABV8ALT2_9FLAO|nr:hypothetical protein [Winogradskyella maritima]
MSKKKRIKFRHLSATGKLKRILKFVFGALIFLTLPTLLLFGFLYIKYNEPLPQGASGPEAEALATQMLDALNHDNYEATDFISWNYDNRHKFNWYKSQNRCEVVWAHFKVDLDLATPSQSKIFVADQVYKGEERQKYINKAIKYFNNDSFWLVAPYKVFDAGTTRHLVKTDDDKNALLVIYNEGGTTPGDAYLWYFDADGRPKSFQMWVDILPIGGLEATWNDWMTTSTGAQLPTAHRLLGMEFRVYNIATQ